MKTKALPYLFVLAFAMSMLVTNPAEARRKKAPQTPLTPQGQVLQERYAGMMESLKTQIVSELPRSASGSNAKFVSAQKAEQDAKAAIERVQKQLANIGKARGLVGHAKGHWIGKANRGIKAAQAKLKKAKTAAEREAAKKELASWEQNKRDGEKALRERTAAYNKVKGDEPKLKKQLAQAKADLDRARQQILKAIDAMGVDRVLNSSRLDGKLAKFVVLKEATPYGMAAFAQKSSSNRKLVDRLLADEKLMIQMVEAEGAQDGQYGRAVQIYDAIRSKYPKSKTGVLHNLALAISLEHAKPISQRNAVADTKAPTVVDPVARYKHYEDAYFAKELDPFFKLHSAWELRFVVDGNEPDEILAWGREMLRNYRPDHITTGDDRWRYVALVRTCVRYGSQENKFDKPELQFFQNILMNGGICGRRAFIGRFILRSFGVPTVRRPQKGHAALARWTPKGWAVCLGGGWGAGWAPEKGMSDLDFLAITQSRATGKHMPVLRAQWVGDVLGETRKYGLRTGKHKAGLWNSVSLHTQQQIIAKAGAKTLAAVGTELGEANTSKVKYPFESAKVTAADRKIRVVGGKILIPAAATSSPTKSTGKIRFLDCVLGGKQLTYSRTGGDQDFSYSFEAPRGGTYYLTMKVVTPSWKQKLNLMVNGSKPIELELPHTVGKWETTKPIKVTLKQGKNKLTFSRKGTKQEVAAKGFSIKEFTLTPAGGSN